jgi:hypothetical protein
MLQSNWRTGSHGAFSSLRAASAVMEKAVRNAIENVVEFACSGDDPGNCEMSWVVGAGEVLDDPEGDRRRIGPDAFELMAIAGVSIHPRLLAYADARRQSPAAQVPPITDASLSAQVCWLGVEIDDVLTPPCRTPAVWSEAN